MTWFMPSLKAAQGFNEARKQKPILMFGGVEDIVIPRRRHGSKLEMNWANCGFATITEISAERSTIEKPNIMAKKTSRVELIPCFENNFLR